MASVQTTPPRTIRIGSCSGFWGDSTDGARQLVASGQIDYLVGDYLAEITMSLLARAKMKDPALGYTPDFVDAVAPLLPQIAAQGIKVVVNAGGLNPEGCRAALAKAADAAGVALRIAVVEGDDLMPQQDAIRARAPKEMASGAALPARLASMNAYLGARPIAAALGAGAQVVITGRCVDSALTLGPLMHEFGWRDTDYDLLSAGSLAGHLIECGAQGTGGLFTDWDQVPGWDDMGFPIVLCRADGSFTVTKPEGTGGLVTPASVGEQMLYEIGDPGAYLLPDVTCDWTGVRFAQAGAHRVDVSGAKGRAPSTCYKVCATYGDGFRSLGTLMIAGFEAARRARRQGEAIVARAQRLARAQGHADFTETVGRSHRCRRHLRRQCARRRGARSRAQDRPAPSEEGGARGLCARVRSIGNGDGAGHHRPHRRPARRDAGDPAVFVPARQGTGARRRAPRRRRRSRRAFIRAMPRPHKAARRRCRRAMPPVPRRRRTAFCCRCDGSPGAGAATRATRPTSGSSRASPSTPR